MLPLVFNFPNDLTFYPNFIQGPVSFHKAFETDINVISFIDLSSIPRTTRNLANLRKIGVSVNTADILRNPEASRHVQQVVNETNRTL